MRALLIFLFFVSAVSCSRAEKTAAAEMAGGDRPSAAGHTEDVVATGGMKADKAPGGLDRVFFSTNLSGDRLLAYDIDLSYRGTNLTAARRKIMDLIPRYGFIENESASSGEDSQLVVTFRVRNTKMVSCLAELDELGLLQSESIRAEDLTLADRERRVKSAREALRGLRRSQRLNQTDPGGVNGVAAEEALSRSEDRQDQASVEAARIQDRVEWARVRVVVNFPPSPRGVSHPPWGDLLSRLATFALWTAYAVALVVPVLLVLAILVFLLGMGIWFLVIRPVTGLVHHRRKKDSHP